MNEGIGVGRVDRDERRLVRVARYDSARREENIDRRRRIAPRCPERAERRGDVRRRRIVHNDELRWSVLRVDDVKRQNEEFVLHDAVDERCEEKRKLEVANHGDVPTPIATRGRGEGSGAYHVVVAERLDVGEGDDGGWGGAARVEQQVDWSIG